MNGKPIFGHMLTRMRFLFSSVISLALFVYVCFSFDLFVMLHRRSRFIWKRHHKEIQEKIPEASHWNLIIEPTKN